jgi:TIR domain
MMKSLSRYWRAGTFFLLYICGLIVLISIQPVFNHIDNGLVTYLLRWTDPPIFNRNIFLIDIPIDGALSNERVRAVSRLRVAQLLTYITDICERRKGCPKAVLLDIALYPTPEEGIVEIQEAIKKLSANTNVYGAFNPFNEVDEDETNDWFSNREFCDLHLLDGVQLGHTNAPPFELPLSSEQPTRVLWFKPTLGPSKPPGTCENPDTKIELRRLDHGARSRFIWPIRALPMMIAQEEYGSPKLPHEFIPFSLGTEVPRNHKFHYDDQNSSGTSLVSEDRDKLVAESLKQKILIIGNSSQDSASLDRRRGPEIVGWWLSDLISSKPTHELLHRNSGLALATTFVCTLISVIVFMQLDRRKITDRHEGSRMLVACIFSILILFLGVFFLWRELEIILVHLTLPIFATVLAVFLAHWHRKTWAPGLEYDVFISYKRSPENIRWVQKWVLAPVSKVRLRNGHRVKIFFDETSIAPGNNLTATVKAAIDQCRVFIPIYTPEYFVQYNGKRETPCWLEYQYARNRPAQNILILPIQRNGTAIPATHTRDRTFPCGTRCPPWLTKIFPRIPNPDVLARKDLKNQIRSWLADSANHTTQRGAVHT